MRNALCLFVSVGSLLAAGVARADDQKAARAIIDRAIEAIGGAERAAKYNAATWDEKGTYYGMGEGLPYTGTYAAEWPNKFRMEIKEVFTIILNGDKGWVVALGDVQEMSDEQLGPQKTMMYVGNVLRLVTLKDKKFQLETLKETEIDGAAAVGVKVSSKNKPDVKLYFDKQSGLLIKSEHMARADGFGEKEIRQETFFKNYKDFDGLKVPTKLVMHYDGKLYIDTEIVKHKETPKLDAALFEAPK